MDWVVTADTPEEFRAEVLTALRRKVDQRYMDPSMKPAVRGRIAGEFLSFAEFVKGWTIAPKEGITNDRT